MLTLSEYKRVDDEEGDGGKLEVHTVKPIKLNQFNVFFQVGMVERTKADG